ncbi:hypothetical protein OA88_01265 [Flavobacterium sp. JRM]|nr:hypothetical protein OA88_01265 [Flavobacterium sp. JRM]
MITDDKVKFRIFLDLDLKIEFDSKTYKKNIYNFLKTKFLSSICVVGSISLRYSNIVSIIDTYGVLS